MLQLTAWSIPPLLAFIVASSCLIRLHRESDVPGLSALRLLMVCALIWGAGQLGVTLLTGLEHKRWALSVEYIGVAGVASAWFLFALTYARQHRSISRWTLATVVAIPAAAIALGFTNDWHGMVWRDIEAIDVDGYVGLDFTPGPMFAVTVVYNYVIAFAGLVVLGFVLTASARFRKPLAMLTFAGVLTSGSYLFYVSPWNPWPWFDPTPIGLSISALMVMFGVVHSGFLDLVPVIRDRVFEHLADAAMIVNPAGRVIDVNASAMARLLPHVGNPLNQNLSALITTPVIPELLSGRLNHTELTIGQRAYHVSVTALDGDDAPTRLALLFRDITERRNAELQLRTIKRDLERMAHTDPLTGLFNRRFFMRRLEEETERFNRHSNALSVLVFDLDLFKRVNDVYGHDAGDRALQVVSSVVNEVRRITDIAARIGGEEFALLLPETDREGATKLAQRLRARIADQTIADRAGNSFRITVSIGVATLASRTNDLTLILRDADKALYRAKGSGRNMVCLAA
jgi:diguanylate cyclase (GGDEF)-like protein